MKKRYLIPLIILGMGAVGTAAGFSVSAYYQNKANETSQLIEKQEEIANDENLNEEEKSKLQTIISELEAKYNEIKDIQVAGTTIGAIAGSIVGALIGMIPALLNRANIKEAIDFSRTIKVQVDCNDKLFKEAKERFDITDKKYDQVIEINNKLGVMLGKAIARMEGLEQQNALLSSENKEIKEMFLIYVNNDKEAVASGVAEKLNKKFGNK